MSKNLYKSKMALEVVDIVENSAAAGQEEESDTMEPPYKKKRLLRQNAAGAPRAPGTSSPGSECRACLLQWKQKTLKRRRNRF